jgi:ABC-type nitrate/sulfonate/bicarbonate transport system permease component
MSESRNHEHILRIKPVFQNLIPEVVIIALLLAVWQGIYESRLLSEFVVTSPLRVIRYLWEPDILRHWSISFERVILGLLFATALAVSLLVAGITSLKVQSILNVLANTLRFIPPIAWIPLAIIWFGIGESSKVSIAVKNSPNSAG